MILGVVVLVLLIGLGYHQWKQSQDEDFEKRDN